MSEQEYCDRCDGTGEYEGGKSILTECEVCGGTGLLSKDVLVLRNQLAAKTAECDAALRRVENLEGDRQYLRGVRDDLQSLIIQLQQRVTKLEGLVNLNRPVDDVGRIREESMKKPLDVAKAVEIAKRALEQPE